MAQVIFYVVFILSTCICLMHCRSLQTQKRSPKYLELKRTGRNAQLRPNQEKTVKRVKRYNEEVTTAATTIDTTVATTIDTTIATTIDTTIATTAEATTPDPSVTTAASTDPDSPPPYQQVIPYVNTGSSYFNSDGTKVAAPVYNYGFYNYPYFLGPDYNKPSPVNVDDYVDGDYEDGDNVDDDYEDPEYTEDEPYSDTP